MLKEKRNQGTTEKPGETKSLIILYMMNSENGSASASAIREHLRVEKNIRESKGVKKHIENLVENGIIYADPEYDQKTGKEKTFFIKDIINAVEFLSDNMHIENALCTPYYQTNLSNLVHIDDIALSESDVEVLKIGLKYSPTLLTSVLDKKITHEAVGTFIKTKVMNMIKIMEGGALVQRECNEKALACMNYRSKLGLFETNYLRFKTKAKSIATDAFTNTKECILSNPLPYLVQDYISIDQVCGKISNGCILSDDFKRDMDKIKILAYDNLASEDTIRVALKKISM